MTNETTASQPKSIGDDAQFQELLLTWHFAKWGDIVPALNDLVAHIDNFRAPAAQASATIQAAPVASSISYWTGPTDSLGTPIDRSDNTSPNVWGEYVPTTLKHGRAIVERGDKDKRVKFLYAAPMVADPAGVPFAYVIYGIGAGKHYVREIKQIDKFDTEGDWKIDDDGLGEYWAGNTPLYLAATVKAVPSEALTGAARDVLAERRRQVEIEGMQTDGDDRYKHDELQRAAMCYLMRPGSAAGDPHALWPWGKSWWKPSTLRRNLVKAGALILAEIERLDRAAPLADKTGGGE